MELPTATHRRIDRCCLTPTSPVEGSGEFRPLLPAISYMLKRWDKLTMFLRVAGAPLDNNVAERALKMSIRHRKNSLSYKTMRGAEVGDLYMSLIHTCYFSAVDPFDYLSELQRKQERVSACRGTTGNSPAAR
jgi:hypothetical protein